MTLKGPQDMSPSLKFGFVTVILRLFGADIGPPSGGQGQGVGAEEEGPDATARLFRHSCRYGLYWPQTEELLLTLGLGLRNRSAYASVLVVFL